MILIIRPAGGKIQRRGKVGKRVKKGAVMGFWGGRITARKKDDGQAYPSPFRNFLVILLETIDPDTGEGVGKQLFEHLKRYRRNVRTD